MQKKTLIFLNNLFPVKSFVSELFFPYYCCVCGKRTDNSFLCEGHRNEIKFLEYSLIEHGRNTYLYAITDYAGVMEKIIKEYKFNGLKALKNEFASIFRKFVDENRIVFDSIAYIPMTKREILDRGYNQTALIAKELSKIYCKPLFEGIIKIKQTKKQVGLTRNERALNVKGAFHIKKDVVINGNILVIDDVYTTGSTAFQVINVLKKHVKGNICFVALARKIE